MYQQTEIKSYMPVNLVIGRQCVSKGKKVFLETGNKYLIVTGKSGAQKSGALYDVLQVLAGKEYEVFNEIEENPSFESIQKAGQICRDKKIDAIIAIGGGSALDGAKAIAVLGACEMEPMDLFEKEIKKALPLIAIPTTAGTGSEVTPYSILTINKWQTKKSFASSLIFPKHAFLDPGYTYSLSEYFTLSTAFDAASHLFESYLSKRSTSLSQMYANQGMESFSKCIGPLKERKFDEETRYNLMYASYLGGMAITHTGTTAMHALGYSMTYFHNFPHGFANLYFCRPYFTRMLKAVEDKTLHVIEKMGFKDYEDMCQFFEEPLDKVNLTLKDCEKYASLANMQASIQLTYGDLKEKDLVDIYLEAARL